MQPPNGSSNDSTFFIRLFRGCMFIGQGVLVLVCGSILKTGMEIRDNVLKYNDSIPLMQRDIQTLKEQGVKYITKDQLDAAETRVRNEFLRQLNQPRPVMSGQDRGQNYEK